MKKSVEILGLPIISITEGRELGTSKTLLIDAKNGVIAALTIEDDDWYRGVKLIPYESIIAIGEDAVTITHSENILNLEEAGDYERLLIENIRVIGTKAITKSGRIQGRVTEVFIGNGGKIEQCEITAPDGSVSEVTSDQISIFGKQVTVINVDAEKKNSLTEDKPAFVPAFEHFHDEPAQEVWKPPVKDTPTETAEVPVDAVDVASEVETSVKVVDVPAESETPIEMPDVPTEEEVPIKNIEAPVEVETPAPIVEAPVEVETPAEIVEAPVEVETPAEIVETPVEVETPAEIVEAPVEKPIVIVNESPVVEVKPTEDEKRLASITQQAEDLKAALQKARASKKQSKPAEDKPQMSQKKQVEKAVDERRRRVLLGKHATKTIATDNGMLIVEMGAEVTEEVLQRARLSNKFIELSMNVQ